MRRRRVIGIYKITSPTGKIYIGSSNNIYKRFVQYKNFSCKKQRRIYRSLLKHGVENHTFEIVEECEFEMLYERERYYQELYDCIGENGLNCSLVKTDEKPKKISEETAMRIGNSHRGKIVSEESRNKMRESQRKIDHKNKKSICITTGKIFNSIQELADFLNKPLRTVSYYLNNGKDIGYKFVDYVGDLTPVKPRTRKLLHIPTGMEFNSITEGAKYFGITPFVLLERLRKNILCEDFKYLTKWYDK